MPLAADDPSGLPGISDMEAVLKPANNVHFVRARLVCLENTNNRRGGHASTPREISERAAWAHDRGLDVHIDGARLFNAAVALGVKPADLVRDADSVQICLSKGLGAPMGSLLCASRDFVERARFCDSPNLSPRAPRGPPRPKSYKYTFLVSKIISSINYPS